MTISLHKPEFTTLLPQVQAALRAWQSYDNTPDNLLSHLVLVQQQRNQMADDAPQTMRLATNQILQALMQTLALSNPQATEILLRRFVQNQSRQEVAEELDFDNVDQVKHRQRDAEQQLTRLLLEQETAVRQQQVKTLTSAIPDPTYSTLFGVDDLRQQIADRLLDPSGPGVVALVGLGGLGKTALADTIVRQVIGQFHFERVLWLRIDRRLAWDGEDHPLDAFVALLADWLSLQLPSQSTAVQRRQTLTRVLRTFPTLVVVDNLEWEADVALLLNHLHELALPSKFLLTSRVFPVATAAAYRVNLPELTAANALALMRHQAAIINLAGLTAVPDETLLAVYNRVGGNPLALKLVVGLAQTFPLPDILADLTDAHTRDINTMYRQIYLRVWQALSANGQLVLEQMPLAGSEGMGLAQMAAITDLDRPTLLATIAELVGRSLLEVRGPISDRRYGIHRLTDAFLQTDIIHLPPTAPANPQP